ncbi:DUF899 domain-containing protein [Candidatus Phyllobacterium onerii]|uniref:DUF899 domain-containing protein n=1 Tax=Candidatus Phyllobacterium onerii TaxID=3020828 RepID=UPI00232BDA0F|nr:DUF899 family protein [Phyllobacterium sp. IY22]
MQHEIVSRDEWLRARLALLAREKAFTKAEEEMSARRRALPWVKVEKEYTFDSRSGKMTLSDLFDGRSQLFIKHFMMGPGQEQQCVGCTLEVDHVEGLLEYLQNNDVSYVAVARAPIGEIETLRKAMGWRFPWVSSFHSDFNYDFNVSFTPKEVAGRNAYYNFETTDPGLEDLSGDSVFYKDGDGQIYHTYSAFSRGGEQFLGIYGYLDAEGPQRDRTAL